MMPPINRNTTAETALIQIKRCAGRWTLSPVVGHVLNWLVISAILILILHNHLPDHCVVAELLACEHAVLIADEEKFSIPLKGRYISYDIKYSPESASNCVFREPRVEYKKLAESSKLFD